jgi:hypothetical protein
MRFIVNEGRKIIFGWSPKCGCTHVKNMIYYLENKHLERIHYGIHDTHELPDNLADYILILVIRNPFKRLISGFLEKYKEGGEFRHLWNIDLPITFTNFIIKILESNYNVINYEHFSPQTSGWFNDEIKTHKKTIIYDIENIDYNYIGSLYKKIIPPEVINFRGNHINTAVKPFNESVYNLTIDSCSDKKIPAECFYNEDLKEKLLQLYKGDFEYFETKGFYYSCKQSDDLIRDHSKCLSKINTYNSSKYKNLRQKVND